MYGRISNNTNDWKRLLYGKSPDYLNQFREVLGVSIWNTSGIKMSHKVLLCGKCWILIDFVNLA